MEKSCNNCKYRNGILCTHPKLRCQEPHFEKWKPKETIQGVAESETISNESGGKQSKLEYSFHLIDAKALFAVAQVFYEGSKKYEKDNWRKISTEEHLNHAISHIYAYLAGDTQDNHLSHATTRLLMALGVKE